MGRGRAWRIRARRSKPTAHSKGAQKFAQIGKAWRGAAMQGRVRRGEARHTAFFRKEGAEVWFGAVRLCSARLGGAWPGPATTRGAKSPRSFYGSAWHISAYRRLVMRNFARYSLATNTGTGNRSPQLLRYGVVRRCRAHPSGVKPCEATSRCQVAPQLLRSGRVVIGSALLRWANCSVARFGMANTRAGVGPQLSTVTVNKHKIHETH